VACSGPRAVRKDTFSCVGRSEDLGTVENGKLADIVVVAGDPLADVTILQKPEQIALVIKDGAIAAARAVDRRL
jgi:imidazolonepropionase-like amidohydrolase